jgi:hypothetical protein
MTSWARSWASSFISRRLTWVLAVAAEMCKRSPISAFDQPPATSARISRSWAERDSSSLGEEYAPGSGRLANSRIRRRVMPGAAGVAGGQGRTG